MNRNPQPSQRTRTRGQHKQCAQSARRLGQDRSSRTVTRKVYSAFALADAGSNANVDVVKSIGKPVEQSAPADAQVHRKRKSLGAEGESGS